MSSVKLIIRCPDQANADLNIDVVKSDWTVRQLKIYLCDVHPSKPVPERQRIVFAGQLLRDEARLSDYFNRYDNAEPFVLHLVYTTSIEENVAAAQKRAKETELRQRKPAPTSASPSPSIGQRQESVPSFSVDNSNQYGNQYWPWMGQQFQMGPDAVANDWMRQQQQMYATMNMMMSQWYGQYMQAYGGSVAFYPSTTTDQPNFGFGSPAQQQQDTEPVAVVPQQEAPPAQGPPQQAMNAQGGVAAVDMDEDDPRNRDWLDYVYMACRASLLIMILYFYSSIERFVFVMLCCTLMYGLQAGWFGRRGQQPDEQQPQPQPRRAVQDPQPGGEREILEGDPNRPDQPERQPPVQEPIRGPVQQEIPMTAWNVFWTTCWTFISSFFASLVPERPPPLNM